MSVIDQNMLVTRKLQMQLQENYRCKYIYIPQKQGTMIFPFTNKM